MNQITQQATIFQQILRLLEKQLKNVTESDYYKQLANSGFYIVEANLVDALQATRETLEINEQMITIMQAHPEDELKTAIAKYLESQTDEGITDINSYL